MQSAKETEIQAAILDYLKMRGHFAFRLNNIPATYTDRHGERRFRALGKYTMKGIPDIVLIVPMAVGKARVGRFVGIEVKAEKGKLTPEQAEFGRQCIARGGEYIVAKSIDDVQAAGL
jgi:hypothetical protein